MIASVRRVVPRPGILGVLVVGTVALGGCTDHGSGEECLPDSLAAEPGQVVAGEDLVVSTSGFPCDRRYDDGKQYALTLGFQGVPTAIELGDVDVARDGSFSVTISVPDDAPPGEAYVRAEGSPYDECPDDASCAGYTVTITVVREG